LWKQRIKDNSRPNNRKIFVGKGEVNNSMSKPGIINLEKWAAD